MISASSGLTPRIILIMATSGGSRKIFRVLKKERLSNESTILTLQDHCIVVV
jgi:hypothetical protein